ncbi:hypothetical protein C8F04DRAFT_1392602 [Mycena alexandri]|uniref:Mtf2-like C-terminal domain-containing protein n=1 Tax=Mycena alexandri TaxID=1745969 RepID=A0AAD6T4M7_9AGAR|nr:hypothetical protein C8F04DRAFT_1392602 [Mycena alexandri]
MQSSSRAICTRLCQISETAAYRAPSKCRLPLSSPFRRVPCRTMSTNNTVSSHPPQKPDTPQGPWDEVLSDIREIPDHIPPQSGVGPRRSRRHTMTAREISAFNEIFNMIFDSMSEKEKNSGQSGSVDIGGAGMGELFGTIRRHSKRMRWTAKADEELDRKKDEMDGCKNDRELLDWAMREVFGESQTYLQEFKAAQADGGELPMLQPPTYPHLIALLMRTFRDTYRDPHLALSMFDYARHLSTSSYVFGCSTSAYNELIATRWNCFRDLKGVHDALEEMSVNGVDMDTKTQELAEKVRQEVGERTLWIEENEIGQSGAWDMLNNIERLVNQMVVGNRKRLEKQRKNQKSVPWNEWRTEGIDDRGQRDWEFDKW